MPYLNNRHHSTKHMSEIGSFNQDTFTYETLWKSDYSGKGHYGKLGTCLKLMSVKISSIKNKITFLYLNKNYSNFKRNFI